MSKLGRYTLYGRIGSGGMATVHLARAAGDDDWFAIKRIHPHLAIDRDVQTMFLNEAKLLSQLSHPVICGVLDFSLHEDTPYLVMRYLHGVSLSALITRLLSLDRPIPVNLMAYVAATICDGLHYAHEATGDDDMPLSLVHRDISPQNIFITFGGSVHLLDFGVAKATSFARLTRTGHVKGKYAYMSPEQVTGQDIDRRSDVFSLGIVLWESSTGRHLFKRRRDIDTLRAIKTGAVPAPSELNSSVPQQLDAIVARSLVADRRLRFGTADDLGGALWRYLTALKDPVGADEMSEALAEVFPHPPTPAERARGGHEDFPGWTKPGVALGLAATDPGEQDPTSAVSLPATQAEQPPATLAEQPPGTQAEQPPATLAEQPPDTLSENEDWKRSLNERPAVRPTTSAAFTGPELQSTLTEAADTALALEVRTEAPDPPGHGLAFVNGPLWIWMALGIAAGVIVAWVLTAA